MAAPQRPCPAPEQVFLDSIKGLIQNLFITNPNDRGKYYRTESGAFDGMRYVADIRERAAYVLERMDEIKHLINLGTPGLDPVEIGPDGWIEIAVGLRHLAENLPATPRVSAAENARPVRLRSIQDTLTTIGQFGEIGARFGVRPASGADA